MIRARPLGFALTLLLFLLHGCQTLTGDRAVSFESLTHVRTLSGAQVENGASLFGDPFGIAIADDGMIYVTDGERGCIWAIDEKGVTRRLVGNLNTPSGVALAPDGSLVVAESGAHVIRRISPQGGASEVIAGQVNRSGFADGNKTESLFNAPVGVALDRDGIIYVADTYNDRIRRINNEGITNTLAGGDLTGYWDAERGTDARFHTPCNLIVRSDERGAPTELIVADTGNHRLRRIDLRSPTHTVTTFAGTGEPAVRDGAEGESAFDEPLGLALTHDSALLVADAGGDALRRVTSGEAGTRVTTLNTSAVSPAGGEFKQTRGFRDGNLPSALARRPSGVAVTPQGRIVFTDTHNRLVRIVVEQKSLIGTEVSAEQAFKLLPDAETLRRLGEPRWAFDPPTAVREIAATFGEVRGVVGEGSEARLHNGLDIPGALGETVRFVRSERVLLPLAVEDTGTARERLRLPLMGYIHVRIGRTHDDREVRAGNLFVLLRDDAGRVREVRVRRGASVAAGDALGTLNNQYHVHLIAGAQGAEVNALAALELPGAQDTVAPTITRSAVRFERADGAEFETEGRSGEKRNSEKWNGRVNDSVKQKGESDIRGRRIVIDADARIIVRAYDQMDGNLARRRLGVYALGYQVLHPDKKPVKGYESPAMNILFERLPEFASASIAYAVPSRAGYTPEAIFDYIVTNRVRDREGVEGLWLASHLPAGDYVVRLVAKDFFGNEATEDFDVLIKPSEGR